MKVGSIAALLFGLVLALPLAGAGGQPQGQSLKTEKEQRSYALGMDLGNQFRKMSIDVDPAVLAKGLSDALAGGKTLMTDAEAKQAIARLQGDVKSRQILPAAGQSRAEANRVAGEAFLADNAAKDGVVTLPSGLQYKVLTAGTGRKPALSDTVVCQYRGTLIDGTEFDSSYRTGQPATLRLTGVIPGWIEALQLMSAGSKWQLFIPAALAYGTRGAGDKVGPNATLIFEIELLAIK
jgi:FKBP-type peptidyl-prolyl cis-trans isomerase FklB